jgi:hypothetical protein
MSDENRLESGFDFGNWEAPQAGTTTQPQLPMEAPGSLLPSAPGAAPLRNGKRERYCWLRSTGMPPVEAYRSAGFGLGEHSQADDPYHTDRGNSARLERLKPIRERINYLCLQNDSEESRRAKARRLEEFLWKILEADIRSLWEVQEVPERDKHGKPVLDRHGNPITYRRQRAKFISELPEDLAKLVEKVSVTESGRTVISTYSRLQANIELRRLLGIGNAPADQVGEFTRLTDEQLLASLKQQAEQLGVPITLRYDFPAEANE